MLNRTRSFLKKTARKSQIGAYFVWLFLYAPTYLGLMVLLDFFHVDKILSTIAGLILGIVLLVIVYRMRASED